MTIFLVSEPPVGDQESESQSEDQGEEQEEGGLSAAERSDAIADRIRKRRTMGRQPNYREGNPTDETDTSEPEEVPRTRKRVRTTTTQGKIHTKGTRTKNVSKFLSSEYGKGCPINYKEKTKS